MAARKWELSLFKWAVGHWRRAWSDDGDYLYSCHRPEDDNSYEDATDSGPPELT